MAFWFDVWPECAKHKEIHLSCQQKLVSHQLLALSCLYRNSSCIKILLCPIADFLSNRPKSTNCKTILIFQSLTCWIFVVTLLKNL